MKQKQNRKPVESTGDFRARLARMLREESYSIIGAAPAHPLLVRRNKRALAGNVKRARGRLNS